MTEEDHLVFRDEEMFFRIVHTTRDEVEAEDLLRRARSEVLAEKAEWIAEGDTSEDQNFSALLAKINDEIHYFNDRRNRIRVWNAVRALWGEDGIKSVKLWMEIETANDATRPPPE